MDRDRLKEIYFDQRDVFNGCSGLIKRDIDLGKYISTGLVVIISGIRRCGKSSLLYLIKEEMDLGDDEYCYFNFDDERIIADVSILDRIYNLHIEIYGREPVLFFDEIQNIGGWEKFVNRLYEKGKKVFVSGSNARLLSSEIATSLTGRNKLLELFPFSFKEYLLFLGRSYQTDRLSIREKSLLLKDFGSYIELGGFPLVVRENDIELINSYFQDILYRDIISRYRLSQVNEIKQIGLYFASNISRLFSYSTLQEVSGVKSTSSVKEYLHYYEQAYLFFYLKKFDFSVKKQVMNPKKVYVIDTGFANRLGFNFSQNTGRLLENIVFIELMRRGKEVYYYSGKSECDFLVREGLKVTDAIQVCNNLDNSNFDRELNGLFEAMHTHDISKGILLLFDVPDTDKPVPENIEVMPIWKWLVEEFET